MTAPTRYPPHTPIFEGLSDIKTRKTVGLDMYAPLEPVLEDLTELKVRAPRRASRPQRVPPWLRAERGSTYQAPPRGRSGEATPFSSCLGRRTPHFFPPALPNAVRSPRGIEEISNMERKSQTRGRRIARRHTFEPRTCSKRSEGYTVDNPRVPGQPQIHSRDSTLGLRLEIRTGDEGV